MKKFIKKIISLFGFRLVKESYYQKLLLQRSVSNKNELEKGSLLGHFYTLLQNQNFYPKNVYDIGANKGTWSQECMRFFPNANYYLFEPQTQFKTEIEENLSGYNNFQVFFVGLGDKKGDTRFTIHDRDDSCSFSFSEEEAKQRGFKQVKLPMVILDEFVKEEKLELPSLIKIDAEGLDMEVLKGAGEILKTAQVIMVEVGVMNNRIPNSALSIVSYLDALGYKFFDITDLNRPFSNEVLWLCEFAFIKKNGVLDKDYGM